MIYPLISNPTRPNRAEKNKDVKYHSDYGRWVIWASKTKEAIEHLESIRINRNYVLANKQWDNKEDISNFLTDTTGQSTNRVKVEMNYIQILVNHHVGNAERTSVRGKCQSFSPMVQVRKEQSLVEALAWGAVAKNSEDKMYSEILKANKPIGESETETVAKHDNYYCDKYIKAMNGLLKYAEVVNNFDLMKKEAAESMAITGMYVVKPEAMSGDWRFRWVQTEDFFFDRGAKKYDLSDAGYMGEFYSAMPTEIYEMYEMLNDDVLRIENQNKAFNKQDRIPVYKTYWRDIEYSKWGYVKNKFGDIVLERIDYKRDDEDEIKYTEKDVVSCNDLTQYQLNILKKKKGSGKAMSILAQEVWRFCEFIPCEYVSIRNDKPSANQTADYVLDYGIAPYMEQNVYSANDMTPPYKVSMYFYSNGYVNSPMCIAINPQRMANRIMSAVENLINNSRGSGTILAEEAVNKSSMGIDEINIRMKRSEAITLPALPFGSIQNAVGNYDTGLGTGAQYLISLSQMFLQSIESITGVNYAMKGQMDNPSQLVGTMQLMIQRGSIIQERFNSALREVFRQMYQSVATAGKRFYINEKPKLSTIVGEEGLLVVELTKDMLLEDFRASIEYQVDKQTERQFVDQMLIQLMQFGLIDNMRASQLMGRGGTEDMWEATREYVKEKTEAEKQMAEQQAAVQQQQAQQQQNNYDMAVAQEDKKINAGLAETLIKQQPQLLQQQQ